MADLERCPCCDTVCMVTVKPAHKSWKVFSGDVPMQYDVGCFCTGQGAVGDNDDLVYTLKHIWRKIVYEKHSFSRSPGKSKNVAR